MIEYWIWYVCYCVLSCGCRESSNSSSSSNETILSVQAYWHWQYLNVFRRILDSKVQYGLLVWHFRHWYLDMMSQFSISVLQYFRDCQNCKILRPLFTTGAICPKTKPKMINIILWVAPTHVRRSTTELQSHLWLGPKNTKVIRKTFNPWILREDNAIVIFSAL